MLSLECVCYNHSISSGVKFVPYPVPSRCLAIPNVDGHEYITSCLFFLLYINVPLEGRRTKTYCNMKKNVLFGAAVALLFAFGACTKDAPAPDNGGTTSGGGTTPQPQQKHNVELVYGTDADTEWQNISLDTIRKYNADRYVDTIFMVPEMYNQYSTSSTNQLKYIIPRLRERHNINPDKIFGKGELQLKATSIIDNPEIVRFFADTLRYNVTSR